MTTSRQPQSNHKKKIKKPIKKIINFSKLTPVRKKITRYPSTSFTN